MRKYYIPTSTLNFNNILSTESISPKAFYDARGFGYSRWVSTPESPCDFAITLYEAPKSFVRPKSDVEDHPLLLEIQSDENFPCVTTGVFSCDHTLYLNPGAARFIFFNEQDKKVALSLTDNSSETKMLRLYLKQISVEVFEGKYEIVDGKWPSSINCKAVENDRRINKLKGLLYGYYIGACISASPESVKRLASYLEVQNVFAAIASSASRLPTDSQNRKLMEISSSLNDLQPLYRALVEFEGSKDRAEELIALLRNHNVVVLQNDIFKWAASIRNDSAPECGAVRWIKDVISRERAEMAKARTYLSPDKDQIVVVDGVLAKICVGADSEASSELICKAWVNDVLCRQEYTGKVSSCKEKLSDALTFNAKDALGDKWENSNVRKFMNQLRRHVRGESFDAQWDNGVLSAVAAVLSKGDDWDDLLRFVQGKGLSDYRLVFAIFGALNGFANLTRDFTDQLMRAENPERIKTYVEFHGQLHGVKIDLTRPPETPTGVFNLKSQMLAFFDSPGFKYKANKNTKAALRSTLLNAFEKLGANPTVEILLRVLSSFSGWERNKKPFALMQEKFAPGVPKESRGKKNVKRNEAPSLPGMEDGKSNGSVEPSLLADVDAWINICAAKINDSKARELFIDDIRWFVGNHAETYLDKRGGEMPGFYKDVDKGNSATIARLEKHLKSKLFQDKEWLVEAFEKVPIDAIIQYLRDRYA